MLGVCVWRGDEYFRDRGAQNHGSGKWEPVKVYTQFPIHTPLGPMCSFWNTKYLV